MSKNQLVPCKYAVITVVCYKAQICRHLTPGITYSDHTAGKDMCGVTRKAEPSGGLGLIWTVVAQRKLTPIRQNM